MLLAFHPIDYGVLLLYFGSILAIGCYFRHAQHTSFDYFLAGKSISWQPVGFSVVATVLSSWAFLQIPGDAYWAGLRLLVIPAMIWVAVPLVSWYVLPMYHGLELDSVYEYLELRFNSATRLAGCLLFLVCSWLWMGVLLCVPFTLIANATDLRLPLWVPIAVVGLVTTISSALGGMKALIWSDIVRAFAMVAAVLAIVIAVWWGLDDGPRRVLEVATVLDRVSIIETSTTGNNSPWSIWSVGTHYLLVMLSLFVTDQITVQRYLVTRTSHDAQRSFLMNCVFMSLMFCGLIYAGLCLLAFYHDHPQALRAKWVVNVNGETLQSLTFADRDRLLQDIPTANSDGRPLSDSPPLLDWKDPRDSVTAESIQQLVAEKRLLHPNRKIPWEDSSELFHPDNPQQLDIEKLAMRRPPKPGLQRGEFVLNTQATDELVPWFIASQLPFGITGIVLAGIVAGTMSALHWGLTSMGTLLMVDFYRRYGCGRKWLARLMHKPEQELTAADELPVARVLTLILGGSVTLFAVSIAGIEDKFGTLLNISSLGAAPLLGVFLLGLLTRRCTSAAAMFALLGGILFTTWLTLANTHDAFAWLWPFEQKLNPAWPLIFGTLFTFTVGYVTSHFCGTPKAAKELRGLVLGSGQRSEIRGQRLEVRG